MAPWPRVAGTGPAMVIAEIGVNHDGSPERALGLVRLAALAGADAIKLQVFRADLLVGRAARLAGYQAAAGETDPFEMLRRLELSIDACAACAGLARRLGLAAIATVFSVELVAPSAELPFDAWKTASPDIIHRPLIDALAATGRPLILSTGASRVDEIRRAVGWVREAGAADRAALLQCISCYPTPAEHAELGAIRTLAEAFGLPVGYSDHTTGEATGRDAAGHGAVILEKHFTDDPSRPGPDHAASLGPEAFRRYTDLAKRARPDERLIRRSGLAKRVLPIEQDVRAVSRQSITAVRDLAAGAEILRGDLTFARPGRGLEPWRIGEVLGRRLAGPVAAGMPITAADAGLPEAAPRAAGDLAGPGAAA